MPRIKSLFTLPEVDVAKHAHNCQSNAKHRIQRGDKRLKVSNERSWNHYCLDCARTIVQRDIEKLQGLAERLNEHEPGMD